MNDNSYGRESSEDASASGSGIKRDNNNEASGSGGMNNNGGKRNEAPKRGYRACVHCRLRKAKCDLGDVNAPSEPPCSRCRREQRNCVFLPSKRRRKTQPQDEEMEDPPKQTIPAVQTSGLPTSASQEWLTMGQQSGWDSINTSIFRESAPTTSMFSYPDLPQRSDTKSSSFSSRPSLPQPIQSYTSISSLPQTSSIPPPSEYKPFDYTINPSSSSSTSLFMDTPLSSNPAQSSSTSTGGITTVTSTSGVTAQTNQPTPASVDSTSTSALSPQTRSKRRSMNDPDATRRIVVANFSNETDALEILAHAATDGDEKEGGQSGSSDENGQRKRVQWKDEETKALGEFLLIKEGILSEGILWELTKDYFEHYHPVLPIVQTPRMPRSPAQLPQFASSDPFLLCCLVLVASSYHSNPAIRRIHDKTWAIIREVLSDYAFGGVEANVGLVEGVLLLAEFLPRERKTSPPTTSSSSTLPGTSTPTKTTSSSSTTTKSQKSRSLLGSNSKVESGGLHGNENRRTWALTGLAIRAAYGLQLDQAALDVDDSPQMNITLEMDRARLAWTWCYLYDRTIGLRTGLAFWSRGPSICFAGYSHISQTGERAAKSNFPSMIAISNKEFEQSRGGLFTNTKGKSKEEKDSFRSKSDINGDKENDGKDGKVVKDEEELKREKDNFKKAGEDSASFIQALMELTQIMTNAHDTLYPNKMRTADLVRAGAYFRFLDSFKRALESFKVVWLPKKWANESLKELTWCTYEMVRLYISSFAFQAHVQRAWSKAEEEKIKHANAINGAHGDRGSDSIGEEGNGHAAGGGGGGGLGGHGGHGGGLGTGFSVGQAKEGVQLFPRGSATSPDALYIYASVDAANEILNICLRLAKLGVLGYLPSRYLINFVFGGVFALKAGYSGAVSSKESEKTRELVDQVCAALVLASPDRDHPASRYGQMLRLLSKKLEELSDQSAVPSRFPTPDPDESDMPGLNPTQNTIHPETWSHLLINHQNLSNNNNNNNNQQAINPTHPTSGGQSSFNHLLSSDSNPSNHPFMGGDMNNHSPSLQNFLNPLNMGGGHTGLTPLSMGGGQGVDILGHGQSHQGHQGQQNGNTGLEGLFDFDVDVNFNLDGFFDDFTLAEGSGFPFR